jgi:hypothetical protein
LKEFSNWREYQEETAAFFERQGCSVQVEAKVQGVRAQHEVDVYVKFFRHGIECKWVIECKLWKSKVPKEKVMALISIVDDIGADRGLILSEKGFQSGAYDATRNSNITLITSLYDFEKTALTASTETPLYFDDSNPELTIYKFTPDTKPQTLLVFGDLIISANWGSGCISMINPLTRSIIRTIDLDNYEAKSPKTGKREIRKYPPGNMTIADGRLFVGQVFSDYILVIDLETQAIIKRIFIPGGGQGQLTSSRDGKTVYFASNITNQFFIIDSATYDFTAVPYPEGGRGCMSIHAHPHKAILFIGIQRGGNLDGKSYFGGNSFLAVYDLSTAKYIATVYLAEILNGRSDDSTPICINYDRENNVIYVGMFQSKKGIYVIDGDTYEIIRNIPFKVNKHNKHFQWVDPLSQVVLDNVIISINRNNCEIVSIEKSTLKIIKAVFLGDVPNGPRDIVTFNNEAIISYPERNGLIFLSLDEIT